MPVESHRGSEWRVDAKGTDTASAALPPSRQRVPSSRSQRGLDWFIFFLADLQTGFGPFVVVYLTTQKWTLTEIGLVLSIGGVVGLIGQMPGGAIIDAARSERLVAGLAVATIGLVALAYAAWPIFPVIAIAATLHAAASCVLGPAIAAISLGLVGPKGISERLGRNARFASLGNGSAAALMGGIGYLFSSRMVFVISFVFAVATVLSLWRISDREIDPQQAHGAVSRLQSNPDTTSIFHLLRQRPLLVFAAIVLLLQLANAAMLPLMAGVVTARSSSSAPALIAASIIVPQAMVALISPSVGRKAQSWGRRPLLMLAFAALALRGGLFSITNDPSMLVVIQVLDGITAAVFGVMIPLIVADVTYGSGHFSLAQGIVGTATGIGASLSPALAGYASDHFGHSFAFMGLGSVAIVGLVLIWIAMPETKTSLSREECSSA